MLHGDPEIKKEYYGHNPCSAAIHTGSEQCGFEARSLIIRDIYQR